MAKGAGDERAVAGDDFLGVDGLVAHGDVDVAVPGDQQCGPPTPS